MKSYVLFQSLGLLINLVEHCDLNRLKLLEMNTLPAYENATEVKETDAILSLVEVRISTANIKPLRGSLGALSVNKLSHIPKLQPISAVYENQ